MVSIKATDFDFIREVDSRGIPNIRKYQTSNPLKIHFIINFLNRVINELDNLGSVSLLDLGGGEGIVSRLIKEKLDLSADIADISLRSLNIASRLTTSSRIMADVYSLPFQNDSYETVTCLEVLEHLNHPEKALKEIGRVASVGAIISVPNTRFFRLGNILSLQNLKNFGEDPGHRRSFNTSKFRKVLKKEFNKIVIHNCDFWLVGVVTK